LPPLITFIGNNELLIREARVYVDDHSVVFVFNGRFWTHAKDVRDVVVTVVARGTYAATQLSKRPWLGTRNAHL
jgi:hypothetical protein